MHGSMIPVFAACLVTAGCASSFPTPTQSLADAQSAERSASELGAADQPKAQLHLQLAHEQIAQANAAIKNGDNERAGGLLLRARADAEARDRLDARPERQDGRPAGRRPVGRAANHQRQPGSHAMITFQHSSILLLLTVGAGCAAALPPQDLLTARADYGHASHGLAATNDPADLHTAETSLSLAEQSFNDNGDTQGTRDLAYVADRRAQIADAKAEAIQAGQQQQQTAAQMHEAETAQLAATSGQLGRANMQLALQGQALAVEQQRRADADKRAAKAAADLAAFASVKQDPRGMVITLSGGVLFVTNKSDLLPGAQVKLNQVAEALGTQDTESKIVVDGYTDSQGTPAYNQDLSQRRAQSVRDYLVTRGIASDRITAQGFGLNSPVADNATPEGRANNRRVEIVVSPGTPKP